MTIDDKFYLPQEDTPRRQVNFTADVCSVSFGYIAYKLCARESEVPSPTLGWLLISKSRSSTRLLSSESGRIYRKRNPVDRNHTRGRSKRGKSSPAPTIVWGLRVDYMSYWRGTFSTDAQTTKRAPMRGLGTITWGRCLR